MQELHVSESLPQLDIRYILHVLWTGKWVILACMLLAMALAALRANVLRAPGGRHVPSGAQFYNPASLVSRKLPAPPKAEPQKVEQA